MTDLSVNNFLGIVLSASGPLGEAGKKALFLRTYSRDVWLFATDGAQGAIELKNQFA